jgi:hypothetical protein
MPLGNFAHKEVLDAYLNATNITAPANVYMALFKSNPTGVDATAWANEVSATVDDTAYARQLITFPASVLTDGFSLNDAAVTFAATVYGSGAAPYNATYFGIFNGATLGAGNLLFYDALFSPISRIATKSLAFPIDAVKVQLF